MRFSRQGYWSRLPFPSSGDLPNPRIKPGSPARQADSLPTELQLLIRKTQSKTTVRYHLTQMRVAILKNKQTKGKQPVLVKIWKNGKLCALLVDMKNFGVPGMEKSNDGFLKKFKLEMSYLFLLMFSHVQVFVTPIDCSLYPWDSPSKNNGLGCHYLLRGIFRIQGSNPCLLHGQAESLPLRHLWSLEIP